MDSNYHCSLLCRFFVCPKLIFCLPFSVGKRCFWRTLHPPSRKCQPVYRVCIKLFYWCFLESQAQLKPRERHLKILLGISVIISRLFHVIHLWKEARTFLVREHEGYNLSGIKFAWTVYMFRETNKWTKIFFDTCWGGVGWGLCCLFLFTESVFCRRHLSLSPTVQVITWNHKEKCYSSYNFKIWVTFKFSGFIHFLYLWWVNYLSFLYSETRSLLTEQRNSQECKQ